MQNASKQFSHVGGFTEYMELVVRHFSRAKRALRILDLPAGSGLLADVLREMKHEVTCADINRERPDYRYVDMQQPLPFEDSQFDAAICLEGVEHLVDPVQLIRELARVVREGGTIVISTPNVMNFYSRLHFLFTGVFYQFNPAAVPRIIPGAIADRGHIFPLSYFQLRYLFEQFGAKVKRIEGDRYKKKVLMPFYWLLLPIAWLASRRLFIGKGEPAEGGRNRAMLREAFSPPLLFSRSLVVIFEKH